jgi:peptidoglycan/LPS O-acetylase OafA/YrhL
MLRRDDAGRPTHPAEFLSARCRRLVPPYDAALTLYLIANLTLPHGPRIGAGDVLAHLSLLHGLGPKTASIIAGAQWSMSVIFQFYLAFLLLYVISAKLGRWPTRAVTAVARVTPPTRSSSRPA